jgi:hypothetical protein
MQVTAQQSVRRMSTERRRVGASIQAHGDPKSPRVNPPRNRRAIAGPRAT